MSKVYYKSRPIIATDILATSHPSPPSPDSIASTSYTTSTTRSSNPTTLSTNSSYSLKPLRLVDRILGPQPPIQLKPSPPQKRQIILRKKPSAQRVTDRMSVKRPTISRQNFAPVRSADSRSTSRASCSNNDNNNHTVKEENNCGRSDNDPALNYPSPPNSLFRVHSATSKRGSPPISRSTSCAKQSPAPVRPPFVVSFSVKSAPVKYHPEVEVVEPVNRRTSTSAVPKPMRFVSPPLVALGQKPISRPKPVAPVEHTPKKVIRPRVPVNSPLKGAVGATPKRLSPRKRVVSASKTNRPVLASSTSRTKAIPEPATEPEQTPVPEPEPPAKVQEIIRTPTPPPIIPVDIPTPIPPRLTPRRPRSIHISSDVDNGESELQRVFSRRASHMHSPALTPSSTGGPSSLFTLPISEEPVSALPSSFTSNPIELPSSISNNNFLRPNLTGGSNTSSSNGNVNTGGTGLSAVRRALLKLNIPAIEDGAVVSRDARIQAEIEKLRAQKKVGIGRTSGQLADVVAQTMVAGSNSESP